jgi:uncharacterized protein (DUF1778 family)
MAKSKSENFTIRLTEQERQYLDKLANLSGVSAGRFLVQLLRREVIKSGSYLASIAVTRATAKKYAIPEKIIESLESPKDLEGIMDKKKYLQFFDEVNAALRDEIRQIKESFEAQEYAEQ